MSSLSLGRGMPPPPPSRQSQVRRSSIGHASAAGINSRRNPPPPGGGHTRSATALTSANMPTGSGTTSSPQSQSRPPPPTSPSRRGQPPPPPGGGGRRGPPPPPGGARRPPPPSRGASAGSLLPPQTNGVTSNKTEASSDALDAARRSRSPPSKKRTPRRSVAKSTSPSSMRNHRRSFTAGVPPSPPMGDLVNLSGSPPTPGRRRPPPPSRGSPGGPSGGLPPPSPRRISQMGPPVTNSASRLSRPPPPSAGAHRRSASMNTPSGNSSAASSATNSGTSSPLPPGSSSGGLPPPVPTDAVNQRLQLSAALLLSPGGRKSGPPSNDPSVASPGPHDLPTSQSSRGFSSKIPFTKRLGGNTGGASPSSGSPSSTATPAGKIGGERGRSKSMAFRLGRLAGHGSGSSSSHSSSSSNASDQQQPKEPAKIGGERGRSRSTAFRLGARRKSSVVLDGARLRATSQNVDISRPDQSYDGKDENDWTQTFSNKLLHKFSLVNQQAEAGLDTINRATKFLNKFAKLQKEFAANVARAAEHELDLIAKKENFSNKSTASLLTSSTKGDLMPSCAKSTSQFYKQVMQYAEVQSTCAQQVESDLAAALDNCYKRGTESRKATEEQEKEASERMRRCEAALVKSKQKAQKALAQNKKDDSASGDREDSANEHQHKKMNLADFKGKLQGLQKKSALEACTRYEVDVQQANFIQKTYLSYDMPSCLSDLQALEELRMKTLRRNLERFGTLLRQGGVSLVEKSKEIEQVVSTIDPQADLDQFTVNAIHQHGEAEVQKPFQYDLKVTVEELMEKQNVSDKNLFGGELSEIMKLPANKGQTVPRIVSALCDAIEASGGFEAEGIFRLSAGADALSTMRKQLLNNNYSIPKGTSPHTCAALLKEFLRGLKSPLIPESLYEQCIRLGLKAKDDPDYPNKPLRFEEMFSKVPEQNKNIIVYLVNYLMRLTAYEEKNRMGVQNLAIVFAPSFLRDSKTASDPLRMMQNAQYESGFVIYLVEYLSQSKADGNDARPSPGGGGAPPERIATRRPLTNGRSPQPGGGGSFGGGLPQPPQLQLGS